MNDRSPSSPQRCVELSFKWILFLAFASLSTIAALAGQNAEATSKTFGPYKATVQNSNETGEGRVLIERGKTKLFDERQISDIYYFGLEYNRSGARDALSGKALTGGPPILLISAWTGGAHCCHRLLMFELGEKFRQLSTIETGSFSAAFKDLDGDGVPEIEFDDGAIDSAFACSGCSPPGRVILKWSGDRYRVANRLMRRYAPSEARLAKLLRPIAEELSAPTSPDLPYDLLKSMMDLSYAGRIRRALTFADEAWPPSKPGLAEFKEKFRETLADSEYWRDVEQN